MQLPTFTLRRVSFVWVEKLVLPFTWKFSLWRSGCQQQKSRRKLMCWQPSHFFQGRRILQACQRWTVLTTCLPGGLYFEACYTQPGTSDTDALKLLVELTDIYFSVSSFAEHESYTIFHSSKHLKGRQKRLLALMCEVDPADLKSWHCSVPSPPASGNRSNQPDLVLVMLFTVPNSNQGVFSSCSFQEFVHQRETLSDSQHCWWDATLILPLCRSMFCCGS